MTERERWRERRRTFGGFIDPLLSSAGWEARDLVMGHLLHERHETLYNEGLCYQHSYYASLTRAV